ncbi:hypothetical protein TNCV_3286111 [Trichonephila clavipes]|nr:hypothetical protein TNCV_3286111 [Trichonephila clavipes]
MNLCGTITPPPPCFSMEDKFYGFNQMLSARGHCLLFDPGQAPTPKLAAIMVKESRHPIDNRRSLSKKNPFDSAGVERMGL